MSYMQGNENKSLRQLRAGESLIGNILSVVILDDDVMLIFGAEDGTEISVHFGLSPTACPGSTVEKMDTWQATRRRVQIRMDDGKLHLDALPAT